MKLEQQVCSLELAKKLKELGCRQESAFYWNEYKVSKDPKKWQYHLQPDFREKRSTAAFTVAELLNMLHEIDSCGRMIPKHAMERVADYLAEELIREINQKKN